MKYNWFIDMPQADFDPLGKAIAELENTEPLLSITKISIQRCQINRSFKQVVLTATNIIQKQ